MTKAMADYPSGGLDFTGMFSVQLQPAVVEFPPRDVEPEHCCCCDCSADYEVLFFCQCAELYCLDHVTELMWELARQVGESYYCERNPAAQLNNMGKISDFLKVVRPLREPVIQ